MEHTSNKVEKVILHVKFSSILPENIFEEPFKFEPFELEVGRIDLPPLKALRIGMAYGDQNKEEGIKIEGSFEYSCKKTSPTYKKFESLISQGKTINNEEFYNHFLYERSSKFSDLVQSLISYISWEKNIKISRGANSYIEVAAEWNMEGVRGLSTSDARKVLGVFYYHKPAKLLTSEDFINFLKFYSSAKPIPLHHELLFDVDKLMLMSSSRSAYLMMYSALEVATKQLIISKFPDTDWIKKNEQGPPLVDLYINFINEKIAKIINEGDCEVLTKMTFKRNKVAHTGDAVTHDVISRHLSLVKKWINRIDVELGFNTIQSYEK